MSIVLIQDKLQAHLLDIEGILFMEAREGTP